MNFCSVLLWSSFHPPPQLSGGRGGAITTDIRYLHLRISVNTIHQCSYVHSRPQILGLASITMKQLFKMAFFEETPKHNFKAKIISVEQLIFPDFISFIIF
jgi:hypothetical protein